MYSVVQYSIVQYGTGYGTVPYGTGDRYWYPVTGQYGVRGTGYGVQYPYVPCE
jgi:hypothetical protein